MSRRDPLGIMERVVKALAEKPQQGIASLAREAGVNPRTAKKYLKLVELVRNFVRSLDSGSKRNGWSDEELFLIGLFKNNEPVSVPKTTFVEKLIEEKKILLRNGEAKLTTLGKLIALGLLEIGRGEK